MRLRLSKRTPAVYVLRFFVCFSAMCSAKLHVQEDVFAIVKQALLFSPCFEPLPYQCNFTMELQFSLLENMCSIGKWQCFGHFRLHF